MYRKFEIYRPARHSGRLEGEYWTPPADVWKPSVSYKYMLKEIADQMTPAEAYRHKLQSTGKELRVLQRVEWRWSRALDLWVRSATTVQAGYRGMKGRQYYRSIRNDLILQRQQREARALAKQQFSQGLREDALQTIATVNPLNVELEVMRLKIYYVLGRHDDIENACANFLTKTKDNEDVHYILCLSRAQRGLYTESYQSLRHLFANCDYPSDMSQSLNGFVCMKLKPPKVYEAITSFDILIDHNPGDMNPLLYRASAYGILQDFDKMLADLNMINKFQPNLPHILAMRARCQACRRNWEGAKKDLKQILYWDDQNPYGYWGMQDVDQPYDPVPMVDKNILDDTF